MAIVITPDTVRLDYLGTAVTVTVQPDEEGYAVDDESEYPEWIHLSGDLVIGDDERGEVTVRADENTSRDARSGRVGFHIYPEEAHYSYLTVEQEGLPVEPYLTLDPVERTVAADDLSEHVSAVDSSDGTCEVDGDTVPDWLSVRTIMEPQVGVSEVIYQCLSENPSVVAREVRVRLYNGDGAAVHLHVTQLGRSWEEGWQAVYAGEFPDVAGRVWRCELLRYMSEPVDPEELEFPADSPLVIEWPSIDFEEAVWGSSATLKVMSPGDRTYIGLYTIDPGAVRLDVYRDGSLWWSGMLDPEFYEEPYERLSGYEVALTFTDFGLLDRLRFDMEGLVTLRAMVERGVELSGVASSDIDFDTYVALGGDSTPRPLDGDGLAVAAADFTDEEGETVTFREALEGALASLALRMVQREGRIVMLDTLGARLAGAGGAVEWSGDSQTLSTDRVYNGVRVTFSPYAPDPASDGEVYFAGEYSADTVNTDPLSGTCQTFYADYNPNGALNEYDFTVFFDGTRATRNATPLTLYAGRFFHILPVYGSAEECSGAARWLVTGRTALNSANAHGQYGSTTALRAGQSNDVITLPRFRVAGLSSSGRSRWMLRLTLDALIDCRYNPFTDASSYNESGNQSTLTSNSAHLFIGARVELYDAPEGGTALWHYDNTAAASGSLSGYLNRSEDNWAAEAAPEDGTVCWLQFYDPDGMTDNGGAVGGWKTNRHTVGVRSSVSPQLAAAPDGEYIPLPPAGGWVQVVITDAAQAFRYGSSVGGPGVSDDRWDTAGVYDILRWWLYRGASVTVVRNSLMLDGADGDDVEYYAALASAAADELGVDTVCGTADDIPPTALGTLCNAAGVAVTKVMWGPTALLRDAIWMRPEELLIGRLYCQYAGRKAVLTGEAETPASLVLTERNQGDRLFLLTADTQDVRMGTSDIEIRELGEDTYTSNG